MEGTPARCAEWHPGRRRQDGGGVVAGGGGTSKALGAEVAGGLRAALRVEPTLKLVEDLTRLRERGEDVLRHALPGCQYCILWGQAANVGCNEVEGAERRRACS